MPVGERDPHTGIHTTGHEWSGITELDTPIPRAVKVFYGLSFVVALAMWILLPFQEMVLRRDLEGIVQDIGAAVRCRPQPHHLRSELHQAVVAVGRAMGQGNVNGHDFPCLHVSGGLREPTVGGSQAPVRPGQEEPHQGAVFKCGVRMRFWQPGYRAQVAASDGREIYARE